MKQTTMTPAEIQAMRDRAADAYAAGVAEREARKREREALAAQLAVLKAQRDALINELAADVKCYWCNCTGCDKLTANGTWVHRDCE